MHLTPHPLYRRHARAYTGIYGGPVRGVMPSCPIVPKGRRAMTDHNANPVSAPPESRILEARLRLFARHMADCENAAKAARLAGYSDHPGTSRATGSRLMQDPAVVAMVEVERRERAQRLRVSEERIVEAYAAI